VPLKQPIKNTSPAPSPNKFILFGEDDIDDEEILKETFSSIDESFSLLFINNGRKVISSLEQWENKHLPCLIVLDYNMPELNGADILRELQKLPRYHNVPKIIWSTSSSITYKNLCLQLGACEYIIKPSNLKDLEQTVKHMLSFCSVPEISESKSGIE
jgi:CheY-like chemotaxis protein